MEVIKVFNYIAIILILISCSNTPELETGEIKTFKTVKQALSQPKTSKIFLDSRKLISRKKIDKAGTPIIFIELESGQNGTLVPYPGQGVGKTWLGADGATVTFDQGILKASRGLGDDIMGGASSMQFWPSLDSPTSYSRVLSYLDGNNQIYEVSLNCIIKKADDKETLDVWSVSFTVIKYEENCNSDYVSFRNEYYIDQKNIVRKSTQYHSKTLGYITTERLDR